MVLTEDLFYRLLRYQDQIIHETYFCCIDCLPSRNPITLRGRGLVPRPGQTGPGLTQIASDRGWAGGKVEVEVGRGNW